MRAPARPEFGLTLRRSLALRCPRCGVGRQFLSWFNMHKRCPKCALRFERGPGYFLGSAYINYGLTALLLTVSYAVLHFGVGWSNRELAPALAGFCIGFPLFFFRYARSLWMGIDYFVDPTGFESEAE